MIVGSKVVCVDDVFPSWALMLYAQLPVKGTVYTVRAVSPGRGIVAVTDAAGRVIKNGGGDRQPEIHVLLEEIRNGVDPCCRPGELGFKAERFSMVDIDEAIRSCEADVEQKVAA